ncbi:endonuclease V [candidate division GN15 bacterium]|nr:endonuclease V [candidate division GN15 bacterium]
MDSLLKQPCRHDWPTTRKAALSLEQSLAERVDNRSERPEPQFLAATDTAYSADGNTVYAAAVAVMLPNLDEVDAAVVAERVRLAYLPGLLYFREGPAIIRALTNLSCDPDVVLVHGHGRAHPRRAGMASLIGAVFDVPTVGCSRRLLAGRHEPPGEPQGSREWLYLDGQTVGCVYRTRSGVKPVFISPGHRCDLETAVDLVTRCLRGHRLPEPLRRAHMLAGKKKRHADHTTHRDHHR